MIIYLAFELLRKSSGYRVLADNQPKIGETLLAADRVYLLLRVTTSSCELLPHSFHPYLRRGGTVSVALSLRFPSVAVSNCRVLHCPDFPLKNQRSFNGLLLIISLILKQHNLHQVDSLTPLRVLTISYLP